MKKRQQTAEELQAELKADPSFQERLVKLEADMARGEAEGRRDEAPLLADLNSAGYQVRSVWDLVNTRATYTAALPILLDHLQRPYSVSTRDGIARALALRESAFAWPVLLRLYSNEPEPQVREALAIALAESSHDGVIGDVVTLALDTKLGSSRVHLLSALKRSKDLRAEEAIQALRSDRDLKPEVERYLRGREKRSKRTSRE